MQVLWRRATICLTTLAAGTFAVGCAGASVDQREFHDSPVQVDESVSSHSGARKVALQTSPRKRRRVIVRSDLDRVLAAGPGALLHAVPIEPVFGSRRRFVGFRIVSLWNNDRRVLRYGVLPGDMVTRINGQPVLTPAHLMQVFKLLHNAATLQVDLMRAGRRVRVTVPIVEDRAPARARGAGQSGA